jgi:hypothetical protein
LEIQFSRKNCQMFSTGFNSGALEPVLKGCAR